MAALGGTAFAAELLAALNRVVAVDHACLMRFAGPSRPPVLESASWRGGEHVAEVQQAYLAGLYKHDPNLKLAPARGSVAVLLQRSAGIREGAYREACYGRFGLLERLTVAASSEGGQLVALNLYRLEAGGAFTAAELATIEALAPLLAALAVKHVAMMGIRLRSRERADRIEAAAARLAALSAALTRRERDVLARVLVGMTSEGIALDLGIGLTSVLTYRRRGYARVGVTSQAELFALCL
ncbi:MAG: LuxR C-terminal-related transcriptional regulator [Rubrivivax sp.]